MVLLKLLASGKGSPHPRFVAVMQGKVTITCLNPGEYADWRGKLLRLPLRLIDDRRLTMRFNGNFDGAGGVYIRPTGT